MPQKYSTRFYHSFYTSMTRHHKPKQKKWSGTSKQKSIHPTLQTVVTSRIVTHKAQVPEVCSWFLATIRLNSNAQSIFWMRENSFPPPHAIAHCIRHVMILWWRDLMKLLLNYWQSKLAFWDAIWVPIWQTTISDYNHNNHQFTAQKIISLQWPKC